MHLIRLKKKVSFGESYAVTRGGFANNCEFLNVRLEIRLMKRLVIIARSKLHPGAAVFLPKISQHTIPVQEFAGNIVCDYVKNPFSVNVYNAMPRLFIWVTF